MSIEALKEQARSHEQNEDWVKALEAYEEAIRRQSDDDQPDLGLYNRAGDLSTRLQDPLGAIGHYERAVDLYLESELPNNAIAILKKILRNMPDRAEVFLRMGQIRAGQGFLTDARDNFLIYAENMQQAGNMEEAFRALSEFADLAPDDVDVRLTLAEQFQSHDKQPEALEQLFRAHQTLSARGDEAGVAGVEERIHAIDADAVISEPSAMPASAYGGGAGSTPVFGDDGATEGEIAFEGALDHGDAASDALIDEVVHETSDASSSDDGGVWAETAAVSESPGEIVLDDDLDELVLGEEVISESGIEAATSGTVVQESTLEAAYIDFDAVAEEEAADLADASVDQAEEGWSEQTEIAGELDGESEATLEADSSAEAGWDTTTAGMDDLETETEGEDPWTGNEDTQPSWDAPSGSADGLDTLGDDEQADGHDGVSDASAPSDLSDAWETDAEASLEDHLEGTLDGAIEDSLDDAPEDETEATDFATDFAADNASDEASGESLDGALEYALEGEAESAQEEDIGGELPLLSFDDDATDVEAATLLEESAVAVETADVDAASEFDLAAEGEDEWVGLDEDEPAPAAASASGSDSWSTGTEFELETVQFESLGEDELREYVEANPDSGQAWEHMGRLVVGRGDRVAAAEAFEAAHAAYAEDRDFHSAMRSVRELLLIDPDSPAYHQRLVEYAHRGDDRTLLVSAFLELGDCLQRTGAPEKSEAVYQKVLDIDPGNGRARSAMGLVDDAGATAVADSGYVDLGSMVLDKREKTTRWTVETQEPTTEDEFDFQDMLKQFRAKVAEHVDHDDVQAHVDLGTAYKEMGLLDEAISEFQQALRADGRNLATLEVLGQTFMEKGQPEVAIRTLTRATALPFDVEDELLGIYYYLGRAHEELDNRDEAVEYFEKVFALDINFEDVTERLRSLR